MKIIKILSAVLVLGIFAFPAPAMADFGTVQVAYQSVSPGLNVNVSGDGRVNFNTIAGVFNLGRGTATGEGQLLSNPFQAFCIELDEFASGAFDLYNIDLVQNAPVPPGDYTPMGAAKASLLNELWAKHRDEVTNSNTAAAFQLSIWEIIYEDVGATYNVNSGFTPGTPNSGFQVNSGASSTATDTANTWLADLGVTQYTPVTLRALTNDGQQDFLVPIPAPGAVILGVIGLGLVGWFRRKFA